MKNAIVLLFAGLLFLSSPGCAKKEDKADVKIPELDLEGVPSLTDDEDDSSTTKAE